MNSIDFCFEDVKAVAIYEKILLSHVKLLIKNELKKVGDIYFVFCSDEYLLEMNKKYLEHDYFTDVITFDYVEDEVISGDVFISIDRIRDNAGKFGVSFLEELYRVVFHGVLHLIGYNDKLDEEIVLMREKENYYLKEVDFGGMIK